jgi:hypothetical protein
MNRGSTHNPSTSCGRFHRIGTRGSCPASSQRSRPGGSRLLQSLKHPLSCCLRCLLRSSGAPVCPVRQSCTREHSSGVRVPVTALLCCPTHFFCFMSLASLSLASHLSVMHVAHIMGCGTWEWTSTGIYHPPAHSMSITSHSRLHSGRYCLSNVC